MFQTITTAIESNTCIITINRPDKLNALNATVIKELSEALISVYNDDAIRSAIITGAGTKAFVAGADIAEFVEMDAVQGEALSRLVQENICDKIENSPKPVIAAVNGFALGGGCELALSCHFIIASDNAKFGQPEVNLGLIPGYGGTQRLTQLAGKNRAMQLLMTGEIFTVAQAQEYGIVNEITTPENLLDRCKEILQLVHTRAPLAVAKIIETVNNFDHTQAGYDLEMKKFGECFSTADKQEGVTAFLEKRKAVFTGK
jgi:enoyl-CoA hydratase